ncbi:MAG: hypothetical protein ACM3X8_03815 [Methanomicrobiales archaeon]
MAGMELPPNLGPKLGEVKSNLQSWSLAAWVSFWGFIPITLLALAALPQSVKEGWFILNTAHPERLSAWFLSSYTHSQLYPHLAGNLAVYFITLLMIFSFENRHRRFRLLAGWSFLAVPLVSSLLTILFWGYLGVSTSGQGFSAVNGALLAYAMFIFIVWGLEDRLEVFDHPEWFGGARFRFFVLQLLLTIMLVLVMVMGLLTGVFMDLGGSVSNGIAHFGGYVTSLAVLFVFDERTERRRYFDTMLGLSILVGVIAYAYYLVLLVRLVTVA